MTIWIMPEFDREGRAVCQFWLHTHNTQYTMRIQQIRNSSDIEPPGGPSDPPLKSKLSYELFKLFITEVKVHTEGFRVYCC